MATLFDCPGMRLFVLKTESNSPVLDDGESVVYKLENVEIAFDKDSPKANAGRGTLYITQSRIFFISARCSFDIDVRFIALHAVSRDADSYPVPCLYCQFAREEDDNYSDGEGDDENETGDGINEDLAGELQRLASIAVEMFLAPSDEADVMPLFDAFSRAALSNPDPVEPGHEDNERDDELIYNIQEVELGAHQAAILDHLESVFNEPNQG
jgi:hypothetical protein